MRKKLVKLAVKHVKSLSTYFEWFTTENMSEAFYSDEKEQVLTVLVWDFLGNFDERGVKRVFLSVYNVRVKWRLLSLENVEVVDERVRLNHQHGTS